MKKLIYFTLGYNKDYIKLAKLCVESLYINNYDGDFLFITNLENELLSSIDFKMIPFFLKVSDVNLKESSANKLKIYKFSEIDKYDKIIFSDLDILWTSNPDIIFDKINDNKFFVSTENSSMSENWWGGNILNDEEKKYINENNIRGINAGIYAFNKNMIKHFQNIDSYFYDNQHLINDCLEQPFFNVYLFRNNIYNTILSKYVSHDGYNITHFDGVALHFAGGPGNYIGKHQNMIKYFNKNIKQ